MTLTQITLFFLGIMAVVLLAMIIHSYLDKRKIRKGLNRLTQHFKGTVIQESLFQYPRFHSERNGRKFDLFFDLAQVGRHHILYSVYMLTVSLPHSFLLIKKGAYQPVKDETQFTEENGGLLSDIEDPYEGRSLSPEWAEQVYRLEGIKKIIDDLHPFSSLQVGPDAIVAGKPYEGVSETDLDTIVHFVRRLEDLAHHLEKK